MRDLKPFLPLIVLPLFLFLPLIPRPQSAALSPPARPVASPTPDSSVSFPPANPAPPLDCEAGFLACQNGQPENPPYAAEANEISAPDLRALPPVVRGKREVVSLRTAHSAAFDMGNGKFAQVLDTQPMHYQDAQGKWQPIDPAFAPVDGGWRSDKKTLKISLGQRSADAKLRAGDLNIGWQPLSLEALTGNGNTLVLATPLDAAAQKGQLTAQGLQVRYPHSWSAPTLQDEWRSGFGQAEYLMRLSALPQLPAGASPQTLNLRVRLHLLPGVKLQLQGKDLLAQDLPLEINTPLAFVDAKGQAIILQPPQIYEENAPGARAAGTYRLSALKSAPNDFELSLQLPWQWIAAPERRFPLLIDPLFQLRDGTTVSTRVYSPDFDHFVGYNSPDYQAVGRFTDGQARLLVKFARPTQPFGTSVSKAWLVVKPTGLYAGGAEYLRQNILAYTLDNDAWLTDPDFQWIDDSHTALIQPGAQQVDFTAGDPNYNLFSEVKWDVTTQVQTWYGNWGAATEDNNHGIMLRAENEFCSFNPNGCGGFYFNKGKAWSDNDLHYNELISNMWGEDNPYVSSELGATGGLLLMVFFQGPTLSEGQIIKPSYGYQPAPSVDAPYYHADHEYRLEDPRSHWQALVARGMGDTFGPNPPTFDHPYGQEITGALPLELRDADDHLYIPYSDGDTSFQPNGGLSYFLLNGRAAPGAKYKARVTSLQGDQPSAGYDMRLIGEKDNLVAVSGGSITHTYEITTDTPLVLWNIDYSTLPANSNVRVDIDITGHNSRDGSDYGTLYNYARNFSARLFNGAESNYFGWDSEHKELSSPPAQGDIPYGSVRLSSPIFTPLASANNYALALAYNGPQMTVLTKDYGSGEFPQFEEHPMIFKYQVRVTACPAGEFPTAAGVCQSVVCPTTADYNNSAKYREFAGVGLWSENGWSASGPPAASVSGDTAPMLGPVGSAPTVAVIGGEISYSNTDHINLSAESEVLLVDCGSLAAPNSPATNYFQVYRGAMAGRASLLYVLEPNGGDKVFDPWRKEDRDAGDIGSEHFYLMPQVGQATGDAVLRRRTGNKTLNFNASYSTDVSGWSDLVATVSPNGALNPPDVAGLKLDLGDTFSFDVTSPGSDKADNRYLWNVRAQKATVSQPAELGGAGKEAQVLILPVGVSIPSDPPQACPGASCIDLRSPDDTFTVPDRVWEMPDIHTNVNAGMVMYRAKGGMQVYSIDHPQAGLSGGGGRSAQSMSQEFSFDTFGASVSVEQEPCAEGDTQIVTVIRGETQLTLPNIGNGTSPDEAIAASFKLCQSGGETSLRSVHLEFHSPVGIPIANSGLAATGISGSVDIHPNYTTINFGLDFQTMDGSTFLGHGDVTIDTRGLLKFQGGGKVMGKVDVDGNLWVAWDPLDVGFEMTMSYHSWLEGFMRAHMWQGQGWQHKYTWLPDNNERHIAAQIGATLHIEQGAAFSWWFIDIPPDDMDFGVEVAFGQFCTNSACSSYEWGVKGKFSVVGYDVGLYYGFDHGFDFILGNDGHVLIDQYGGRAAVKQNGRALQVPVRAASAAVNGVSTETLTVSANTENLLAALGWQAGAPTLTLYDPDGVDVSASSAYTLSISQTVNSKLMGVQLSSPKPGNWKAVIGNLNGDEHYKFVYFANKGAPGPIAGQGRFLTPANIEDGTNAYTITWETPSDVSDKATISLFYTTYYGYLPNLFRTGVKDAPIVLNLPYKQGRYVWDTAQLENDCLVGGISSRCHYEIRAIVDDGVNDFPAGAVYNPDDPCQTRPELPGDRAFQADRFPGLLTFTSTGKIVINDTVAPVAPTGLELIGTDGAILARWNPSPEKDLSAYRLRWGQRAYIGGNWIWFFSNDMRVTATLSPTARLGGLISGTTYAVELRALDNNGNLSDAAPVQTAAPTNSSLSPIPRAPISLTLTAQDDSALSFSWHPAASGPTPASYRLSYQRLTGASEDGDWGYVDTSSASLDLSRSKLQSGATYRVSVSAANSQGWRSAAGEAISVTVSAGVDDNGDGLPDDWALAYGVSNAGSDNDGDGLSNLQEFQLGTSPIVQDSDGDGFSDWEEKRDGTDPLDKRQFSAALRQPRLQLAANHRSFYLKKGGSEHLQKWVTYSNVGSGTLKLSAASDQTWITPSFTGTLIKRALIDVDAANLSPGYHTGVVRLNAGSGGDPLIGGPYCIRVEAWVSPSDAARPTIYLPLVMK